MTNKDVEDDRHHVLQNKNIPGYVAIYRIHGPFLFGATEKLSVVTDGLEEQPSIVILRLRNMTAIDATGLLAIEELADKLHASGRELLLCGARPQPAALMQQVEFERHVGRENICPHIDAALRRAKMLHEASYSVEKWIGRRTRVVS